MISTFQNQFVETPTAETHASSMTLDSTLGRIHTWTATGNETLTATGGQAGAELLLVITCDGTPRTISFSAGFHATGNFTLTASKISTISFIHDGNNFLEAARATLS